MNLKNKPHGFTVPEGYFAKQNELQEGLNTISEVDYTFEVPSNYFEKSEKKLMRLGIQKPKNKTIQLLPYASSIAACLILALLLNNPNDELKDSVAIEHYFEEQESPLSTIELLELSSFDGLDFNAIAFENMAQETVFELQQAYDPDFNLIYENYED